MVCLFEGASMGVLMMFHLINFQQDHSILSQKEEMHASIKSDELHFFPDGEVEAVTPTPDRSCYAILDSE